MIGLSQDGRDSRYLRNLSDIRVTRDELVTVLELCDEPDAEAGGFWGLSMIVGDSYPSNPLKANAILARLEALLDAIPNGYSTGWALSDTEEGVTIDGEFAVAAAALVSLKRDSEGFRFDRGEFVRKAFRLSRDRKTTQL